MPVRRAPERASAVESRVRGAPWPDGVPRRRPVGLALADAGARRPSAGALGPGHCGVPPDLKACVHVICHVCSVNPRQAACLPSPRLNSGCGRWRDDGLRRDRRSWRGVRPGCTAAGNVPRPGRRSGRAGGPGPVRGRDRSRWVGAAAEGGTRAPALARMLMSQYTDDCRLAGRAGAERRRSLSATRSDAQGPRCRATKVWTSAAEAATCCANSCDVACW